MDLKITKPEVYQFEDLHREATVVALPAAVTTEAGVVLDLAGAHLEGVKIAKDGHVRATCNEVFFSEPC